MSDSMNSMDSEIMRRNGLFYKMPQELSTTVNRTFIKEFSQGNIFSEGDTIVIDINSGSAYIEPTNAMLSFNLKVIAENLPNALDEYSFGSGSACNLFKEIKISSKNGTEILRTQNANVLSKILLDYKYSSDAEGVLNMSGRGGASRLADNTDTKFVVPMKLFSSLYEPTVQGMKIPSGLSSGMRIEITLENASRALVFTPSAGGSGIKYVLSKPTLFMMAHTLNDPTAGALSLNSGKTGLEYTYPQYFNSPVTTTSQTINEQVKKAVARANRVMCAIFTTADDNDELKDSFKMRNSSDLQQYQWRVGSSYYPKSVVTDDVEAWYLSTDTFNKIRDIKTSSAAITLQEYQEDGKFLLSAPIESESALNLSGVSLSNSNTLALELTVSNSTEKSIHIFTEYTTVARTFVNSTSIKI
jgi:hypothetical protein